MKLQHFDCCWFIINNYILYHKIQSSSKFNKDIKKISTYALDILREYCFPGNVRELRNLCERLTILLSGRTIEPENLPHEFHSRDETTMFSLPDVGISLETLEADLIHQALQRTNGNRSQSARLLGISRDTLMYRIQKHGLVAH